MELYGQIYRLTGVQAFKTALNLTWLHLDQADFYLESLHNLQTSKEHTHIVDRVPGTPAVNALPKMLSAANAKGWDTAGYVTPNLEIGLSSVLKLFQLKLYTRLGNKCGRLHTIVAHLCNCPFTDMYFKGDWANSWGTGFLCCAQNEIMSIQLRVKMKKE